MLRTDAISLRSIFGKSYIKNLKKKDNYLSSESTRDIFEDGGETAIKKIIFDPKRYCIKAFGVFADWEHISKVTGYLKPSAEIKDQVEHIMGFYKRRSVVGIHIRKTDHTLAIENSPLHLFTDQMRRVLLENPDTFFYLATDDADTESRLSKEFPLVKHECFSKEKNRKTEAGMMDAYVDMLCLNKCDKIYGSYGSTFSKMASVIGNKECVVLQKSD